MSIPIIAPVHRYVIRGGQAGYERLQFLARARRADTMALLARAGVGAGMRCVDLGCGGGHVSFELARLVGPKGSVLGIDVDGVKLGLAREVAGEQDLANVEFREANVTDWEEPGAYDLVYCRFLLQHLRRPIDLLRRMWSAVRAGGVIVVEDSDFEAAFCEPSNRGYEFHQEMYQRVLERNGGDPATGRKLYGFFAEIGIPDPELRIVQGAGATGESKQMPLLTLEAIADSIVAAGLASPDEVAAAIADLAAFTSTEGTLLAEPRVFQLWARR